MATIMPQGELMRRAVKWVDAKRAETDEPLAALCEKAAIQFNLGPKDAAFLDDFFKERKEPGRD